MATGTRPGPDDFDIALAALVRSIMARRNPPVNVTDLATRTGIARATVSKLVNGRTSMAVWQLRKISEALSVDPSRLIERAQRVVDGTEVDEFGFPDASGERRA
jgi:DNA-binding Xre family transcriptional regulator